MAPVNQEFSTAKNYGADMFKQYAMNNVTTDDIDKQIEDNKTKKFQAFADIVKYAKANNISTDPKMIKTMADQVMVNMDNQNALLLKEKQARLQSAEQQGNMEYQSLSTSFMDARRKQMGIDQQILDESTKPQTDPDKIVELKTQKEEADKKVEDIKKKFKEKGIEQPEAILRQGDTMEEDLKDLQAKWVSVTDQRAILTAKYPDQEVRAIELTAGNQAENIDSILYATALGQYDDAKGQFNASTFLADTKKIPEYQGLTPTQIGEKLIDQDNDIASLSDMFYVTNKLNADPKIIIQKLIDKELDEQEVANIVLNGYMKNATTAEQSLDTLNKLLQALKDAGLSKSIAKQIIQDNGLDFKWRKASNPKS
jgi:hypothetical protein